MASIELAQERRAHRQRPEGCTAGLPDAGMG